MVSEKEIWDSEVQVEEGVAACLTSIHSLMSTTKPPSSPEGGLALTELLTPQQEPFTQSVINFSSAACGFRL